MIMVIPIGAGLCRPFAYNWNKSIPGGKCGNLNSAYIAIAALDIIGDAMIVGEFGLRFEFFCLCIGGNFGLTCPQRYPWFPSGSSRPR